RGSIGVAARGGTLSRASTIACACAKPRVTSPTEPVDGPATLSGHSSKTRAAPGASAASTVAAAGSISYRTSTAAAGVRRGVVVGPLVEAPRRARRKRRLDGCGRRQHLVSHLDRVGGIGSA